MNSTQDNANVAAEFTTFISGLMVEGLVALGIMEHPLAKGIKKDLRHASMVIDTLAMLKEKTSGNLSKDEEDSLENILSQLRMGYVNEINKEGGSGGKVQGSGDRTQEDNRKTQDQK